MATAQTNEKDEAALKKEQEEKEAKAKANVRRDEVKVSAEDVDKLKEDPRFDLPVPKIRTAEDAYQAYLREEIDEAELRAAVAALGGSPFYALKGNLERPDNAFHRDVPEDLYDDPSLAVMNLEDRQKLVEDRQTTAKKATEQAELENSVKK